MISLQDAKDYLGIDVADVMVTRNIERAIKTAESYLKGAIGEIDTEDPRAKELALIVVSDLYDNRGLSNKVSGSVRKLVSDFELQLRLENRK